MLRGEIRLSVVSLFKADSRGGAENKRLRSPLGGSIGWVQDSLRPVLIRGFAPVFLLKLVSSQAVHGSLQWLDNTEEQLKPSFEWLDDNLRNINRRTCPKTNEKDR